MVRAIRFRVLTLPAAALYDCPLVSPAAENPDIADRLGSVDQDWLRGLLLELEQIDRPSASPGELAAAEWMTERFAEVGAEARIELERANGTYWWPLGICAAAGAAAGVAALRGRRLTAAALGGLAAVAMADEYPPGKRRLRNRLPQSETSNVICELGPADADRTIVIVSHHDSAHSGLVFHPEIPQLADRLGIIEGADTSPMLMAPVIGGPILGGLAGLTGSRLLAKAAIALGLGATAAMADIGSRSVVPGANDNGTACILLIALAKRLVAEPTANTRVMLVSAGAEESFSEGMKAFGERHFGDLPKDRTFFMAVDSIGSPHLNVLRGEGFLKMYEYPEDALALIDGLAEDLGIHLYPNLRLRNGTDGLEPLAAGYPTVTLCSCTDLKQPLNYHWPNDLAENVHFDSVADAVVLSEAVIRSLDGRWLGT